MSTPREQKIRFLRDFPHRAFGPLWYEGETAWAVPVEPPPGCRGFKGWQLSSGTDFDRWMAEEGVDAELAE